MITVTDHQSEEYIICEICQGLKLPLNKLNKYNENLINHLYKNHLPLSCENCNQVIFA